MNTLAAIKSASGPAERSHARQVQADDSRVKRAEFSPSASSLSRAAPAAAVGVQTSFSPQSLEALADTALDLAGSARDIVHDIGEAGTAVINAATQAVDVAGSQASELIEAGADALVSGIGAVRSGVQEVAKTVEGAITDSAQKLGDIAESTVGYGALAVLAGGALLNELV